MYKTKRIIKAAFPSLKGIQLAVKMLIVLFIAMTFVYFIRYAGSANAEGTNEITGVAPAIFKYIESGANGEVSMIGVSDFSPAAKTAGGLKKLSSNKLQSVNSDGTNSGQSSQGDFMSLDYGATGALINGSAVAYDTQVVSSKEVVQYYASKAKGTVYAATPNPLAGTEVLSSVILLSEAVKNNFAYPLLILILLVSALNILISQFGGGESKVSIAQLIINAAITFVVIASNYLVIGAIYDITVTYGNALVANFFSPYMNSKVLLERLGPNGDLSLTAVLNNYEVNVGSPVLSGLSWIAGDFSKLTSQSIDAVASPFGALGIFVTLNAGLASYFINTVVSGAVGSSEIIDCIIAWLIFIMNFKIFLNVLSAFVKINILTAFSSLSSLKIITGGVGSLKDVYAPIVASCLVFPATFAIILFAGAISNQTIENVPADGSRAVVCTVQDERYKNGTANFIPKPYNATFGTTRNSIVDVKQFPGSGGKDNPPSCSGKLINFSREMILPLNLVPRESVAAMFQLALTIGALVMCGRVPAIIGEFIQIKEPGFLKGLAQDAFSGPLKAMLAVGGIGAGLSWGITKFGAGIITKIPTGKLGESITKSSVYQMALNSKNKSNIGDLLAFRPSQSAQLANYWARRQKLFNEEASGRGWDPTALTPAQEAELNARIAPFDKLHVDGATKPSDASGWASGLIGGMQSLGELILKNTGALQQLAGVIENMLR